MLCMLLRFGLALVAAAAWAATPLEHGLALLADGRLDGAQAALRKAVEHNPDSAPTRNALGVALSRARLWPQAIEEFRQAVRLAPEHAEAHFNLGIALAAQTRHAEAAAAFSSVLTLKPGFPAARTALGTALGAAAKASTDEGNPQAAIRHYRNLLAIKPSPETYVEFAAALLRNGELDAAQAALEEALREQPDLALAHFLLGRTFELGGEWEPALREYREGVRLDAGNVEFALRYGSVLAQTEPKEGIVILTKALESASAGPPADGDDLRAQAHFAIGSVWARLGDRERADSHFEKARARRAQVHAREQALVHLNQGIARLNSGDLRVAAAALQRSVTLAPKLPEALHMLGVAKSALNDWPAANQSFQAALKARPRDAYILSSYAAALYKQGRIEQALSRLEEALEIDPERQDARCLLEKANRRLGRVAAPGGDLGHTSTVGACRVEDEP